MKFKTARRISRNVLKDSLFASALIMSLTGFASLSSAQGQLPDAAAQNQVPSAFPGTAEPAQGTTQTTAAPMSGSEARTAAQSVNSAAPSTRATGNAAASSTVTEGSATEPSAAEIPAQPESRRLVPATPMGSAAQGADSGQGGQAQPQQAAQAPSGASDNPVEAAAAAMDADTAQNGDLQPAEPDIMEQYAAKAEAAAAEREGRAVQAAAAAEQDDALPQPSTLNMVRLEGSGFRDAAAGNRVSVPVDGQIVDGKTKEEQEDEIRAEAFDAAITGMFPLSPEQIKGLLKRYDATQGAAKKPVYDDPKPEISVQNVSLDPGVAPPVINTAVGNVTTINVLDATGAPWPVQDVTWAGDYEVVEPEEGGHIIRITPMSEFAHGNIVIRLLTLKTPLTMTLKTSRDVVQYRVDARIPEYGPFASAPIMSGGKSLVAGSPDLTSLLDGVMPGGMSKLQVTGVDGRTTAYEMGGMTFVRTPLTLLSPAWQSSVSSADGMNVYALTSAPVLLLSDGGEFTRATISEKEDLLDE